MDVSRQIDLRIDELVLDGLDGVDGRAVRDALRRELGRLFTEHGVPEVWRTGATRALPGRAETAFTGGSAEEIGLRIAGVLYRELVGGRAEAVGGREAPGIVTPTGRSP